jgi:hypothetical protein
LRFWSRTYEIDQNEKASVPKIAYPGDDCQVPYPN